MAIFTVNGRCKKYHQLHDMFCKSGCGRPLAVCPRCKELYILNAYLYSSDMLLNYLRHKSDPINFRWDWMRMSEYCLMGFKYVNFNQRED
ncbi:hypothetical protein LCGC14_1807320 [marine sediment metagenome]|uniref:Uncharacterized protein n=1 Tax=marine sediment metagenome TaxID=412755 RepID=A0A0F9JMH4_9ZZZZ